MPALPATSALSSTSLPRAWLMLLALTAATFGIGESGWTGHGSMALTLALFALTFVKGLLVILDFLELRHAPPLWRWLVLVWLALVLGAIVLAYWISL